MNKLLKLLFSRMILVPFLIVFQISALGFTVWQLTKTHVLIYIILFILSIWAVIYIISTKLNPSYKLAWTILVLLLPVFGGLFYLLFGFKKITKRFKRKLLNIHNEISGLLKQDEEVLREVATQDKGVANQMTYLVNNAFSPVYKNTYTEYLSPGEEFFETLRKELKKAREYIFMEYFIIQEGEMWDRILEILEEKVKEGVDVRVIYDDMGCIKTLPYKYYLTLREKGIKCIAFNRVLPFVSFIMNNRDHRKITVIDGNVAFTGGINLADEYINHVVRFGHWKDCSLMIKGEAVWNLTTMFLELWSFVSRQSEDYKKFKPKEDFIKNLNEEGYVQPYGDSPLDDEVVGENVYLNIINKAKDYVYINTPYLIIDNELVTALTLAAKGGVDVRIVTPHIPDKWYVHMLTRAYYANLIEAGVKIYEYTPGFIHSKTFVSDDEIGTIGTINMDYRSLYLHFECGVLMYKTKSLIAIKKDFLDTLDKCQFITLEDCHRIKWSNRFIAAILRVLAPIM